MTTLEMKNGNIFDTWGGMSGAQTTLNILLDEGYGKRKLSLQSVLKLTSTFPAKRFQLYPSKQSLVIGSDADLSNVAVNKTFILKKQDLFYKHPHSPYSGRKFRGRVFSTFVRGRVVYQFEKKVPLK